MLQYPLVWIQPTTNGLGKIIKAFLVAPIPLSTTFCSIKRNSGVLLPANKTKKNAFLKFLMIKYDNLLSDDNKLPPTRRKTLPTLAADALKYTNHHSIEVAAVEETTGGEVAGPGLEMPPVQQLTGRLRDMAEAIRKCNKRPKKKWKNLQMKMMMRLKKRRESAGARRRSPSL